MLGIAHPTDLFSLSAGKPICPWTGSHFSLVVSDLAFWVCVVRRFLGVVMNGGRCPPYGLPSCELGEA